MTDRYTLPGTELPEGALPPALLFHRWQAYDRFRQEGALKAFKRESASLGFLRRVATEAQNACKAGYGDWHQRFAAACTAVGAEPPVRATTLWRLVIGWGTNPAFETGITIDHFLGFPCVPGSAVKGLLHRVAEQELLEDRGGAAAIAPAPETRPAEPPAGLAHALARCLRVRALFGSLHLRHGQEGGPEAPFDRLAAWRGLLAEPDQESGPWTEIRRQLLRLCSEAPAGGMVTCFDTVPVPEAFSGERTVLTPDVLTPHKDDKPNPIPFLAVRDGVTFELRYRLAAWPSSKPRDREEEERSSDLGGIDRNTVAVELKRWLVRGLAELGLGGKTSAGYGYLLAEGARLPMPRLLEEPPLPAEPKEVLSEAERLARAVLPDGIDGNRAVAALDNALRNPDLAVQTAVAARFRKLFSPTLKDWRGSLKSATRKRVEAIDRLLSGNKENEP